MNRTIMLLVYGISVTVATYVYCITKTTKVSEKLPVIVWSDQNNPPVPGFEQHVDMYYSTHRDTIYMERSYGPKAE